MSSDNQSCLRFSIEESVWFQKGQEVSELVSISLDPDIVIQEHDQYVSIRGALKLSGEYHIDQDTSQDETRDFTSARLVNEIITREDGITELNHRFPVDITIPKYRIESLEDVYVAVEAFDYDLPKRGCMQIAADLSISGIRDLNNGDSSKTNEANQEYEEITNVNEREEEVQEDQDNLDVNERKEAVAQVEQGEVPLVSEATHNEEIESEVEAPIAEVEQKREEPAQEEVLARNASDEDEQVWAEEEVTLHTGEVSEIDNELHEEPHDDDLFIPFEVEARKEAYQEQEEANILEVNQENEEIITPQIGVKARHEKTFVFGSSEARGKTITAVEDKNHSTEALTNDKQVTKRNENELYLTKIFTRDEEEELSKMKICIVQNGDSLDKIAERYEISVQQLIRANSLTSDHHVSEGQLLYIPTNINS
ncbi:stage VI sporulation protein D [Ferdinandcohnia quinoae]|uniref:Stage VI sporulation protein D n=1 Tax=Fredinandcohnia quinoae TaxID=2918902 RepID=A0AAW5E101_9BACI|nr:stage VI sporulation protein D [Fredinandcohnia sp. SECRCQ15]MCH1626595.1 stage VI sporulation protein D [Fredinandcohnia sp. SECRCQ15]